MSFERFQDLATRMFAKLPAATLTRDGSKSYDQRTRKTTVAGDQTIGCTGKLETVETRSASGELVHITTALLSVEPQTGDRLTFATGTWKVVSWHTETLPDGTGLYWVAVVTK